MTSKVEENKKSFEGFRRFMNEIFDHRKALEKLNVAAQQILDNQLTSKKNTSEEVCDDKQSTATAYG